MCINHKIFFSRVAEMVHNMKAVKLFPNAFKVAKFYPYYLEERFEDRPTLFTAITLYVCFSPAFAEESR